MKFSHLSAALALSVAAPAFGQAPATADLRNGKSFIPTQAYSAAEDQRILQAFENLRVADVSDGMDFVGLPDVGLMNREIHPSWKDTQNFKHRFIGIAVTARYVPTQRPAAVGGQTYENFRAWEGKWYNELSPEPFVPLLRPGSAIILDEADDADVGSIGSANILIWKLAGAVGVVTDGSSRDTDEIATQQIPLYLRRVGRGIRPGRNEIESVNRPVVVGGVLVKPGDVIVADGDGVIVVPRGVATRVAEFAHKIIEGDKAARRDLYKRAGLPEDSSVK
jgi:4-hydroxy-4-methyl-2-oxoglutarate aldolase